MLAWEGSLESQLELGFCSTEESLVDVSVGGVESNVGAEGVGEAFEDDSLAFRDVEECA